MIITKTPQSSDEFEKYYQLRWQILRKPWQQPLGSEQDSLEQQACHRMLTDSQNKLLAVGRFHKTSQHQAQIRYMAVATNQQGKGLGAKILKALEQEAAKQGVTEITLNARENAIGFYQKQGYSQQGFSHQLYGEVNHYFMIKKLPHAENHQQNLAQQLQKIWHNTIPLSKAMNLELNFYDGSQLQTSCDPQFNKNLHNTMFAGSIYTLATLTGWGWVYMQLEEQQLQARGDTVLADGKIRYFSPIESPAYARTNITLAQGAVTPLTQHKKARFTINVEVMNGDKVAALFEGVYVVIPKALATKKEK